MTKPTYRKLLRRHGGVDKDGNPVNVEAGKKKKVPMDFRGTKMLVSVSEGQSINPTKEYFRQLGINRKKLKKIRAKAKRGDKSAEQLLKDLRQI